MLYLIGGKSQVGKSEISREIKKRKSHLIVVEADKCRILKTGRDPDKGGWARMVDYINSLDSKDNILIEGVAVTPERVKKLEGSYALRAVFIGFGNKEYVNVWIRYAKEHPCGYLAQEEIRRKATREQSQFAAFSGEIEDSKAIKERAEKLGYRYFRMTEPPSFKERIQPIVNYLLSV